MRIEDVQHNKLREEDWCLQRYLYQEELDASKQAEEKIITTLIYGVTSSGNQAQRGLRLTAELSKNEFPEAHNIVLKDTYMDDIMSGELSVELAEQRADEMEIMFNRGGFSSKGATISGRDPDPALSADGVSILVAGHRWFSKKDKFGLNIKGLNFARKRRGRKVEREDQIPSELTRLHCVSNVHGIFDLSGLKTPITANMKVDLHKLVIEKLDWGDHLPNDFLPMWRSHFEMIEEMKNIFYDRAVVPEDAVSLDAETLEFGDASKALVCVAIYIRFKKRDGTHSCQLLFARSRLVPNGMTQPRAELYAAVLNAHSGEVVHRALSKFHSHYIKLSLSNQGLFGLTALVG